MKMAKTQEQIKQDVVNQLAWDSRVDANNVDVDVSDGTVTLSGTVPTYTARSAAEDAAWVVIGVTNVNNQVNVEFPTAFTVPSDEDIHASVQQRLEWNSDVDENKVTVKVDAGTVTLEGSVPSFWQSITAQQEAESAIGVISVVNKLAVVPTKKITDEVLGERVADRVDQNTLGNIVDQVDIRVKDGKVTLSGTVPSWSDWRSVYDAAQFTTGVTEIEDNIQIQYA